MSSERIMTNLDNNYSPKLKYASLVPGGILQFLDINLDIKKTSMEIMSNTLGNGVKYKLH